MNKILGALFLCIISSAQADECIPFVCKKENPSHCTMTIYAPPGHKVKVTTDTAENGLEWHQKLIADHLKIGEVYTVARTVVASSSTSVVLSGFEEIRFNSVNFVDLCVVPEAIQRAHPDW